jgi:ABC-type uncharacterized transport system substrate-binding protein
MRRSGAAVCCNGRQRERRHARRCAQAESGDGLGAHRAQNVPVVYHYVSSGLKAGAGKSNTDHAPNVTGVSLLPPDDETLSLLRTHFPSIHRIGTLYCPAETNRVHAKVALDEAAKRAGFEVVYVPAETATDVPDAAAA